MSKTPVIYNYDRASGLLISEGVADPDPMQTGQWLIPAYATTDQPPAAGQNQVAVFGGLTGWRLITDTRGAWFNAQGAAIQINDLKVDTSALTRTAPPSPEHDLIDGQWQPSPAKVQARFQTAKDSLLSQARGQRETVLNRLMGIAFAAEKSGDSATVMACMAARQSLLDLTKHATITAAETEPQLKTAYKSLYGSIVANTPAAIRSVYADVQV